jgi:hypothetical protein
LKPPPAGRLRRASNPSSLEQHRIKKTHLPTWRAPLRVRGTLRAEISAIPGVSQVDVDVASGEVSFLAEPVPDMATLRAAVEEAGYQLADPT